MDFLQEVLEMDIVRFKRSTKPEGAMGRPWLLGFHDGSLSAFCMIFCVLWVVQQVDATSKNVFGKCDESESLTWYTRKATIIMAKS